ncbi:DUF2726 domain-containing protein [Parendozoicomonas sp. Alg238-R29]|uniref:DUF2726 domain-containing protein n=1 Tax=Parendozoicomonas sp. Alg238-R29 TaxID=2993446 RepID=UPI00248D6B4A|nr:DUF2726 domain-containing protein [Parendozoicomonas sp. Alg238-R29]
MTGIVSEGALPFYVYPLLLIGGLCIFGLLIHYLLRKRSQSNMYLQNPLFDGPSRSIYGLLDVAVREHFNLFRNVDIADVIRSSGMVSPLPGKVRNRHFDLLLCDRRKMLPKCGIVLVDKGENLEKKTSQLREFCERVELPLLVYETGGFFDVTRLRRDVYQATGLNNVLGTCAVVGDSRGCDDLQDDSQEEESSAVEKFVEQSEESESRSCKKCGARMVARTISKGRHAGHKALVCETFPTCRHAILMEEVTS